MHKGPKGIVEGTPLHHAPTCRGFALHLVRKMCVAVLGHVQAAYDGRTTSLPNFFRVATIVKIAFFVVEVRGIDWGRKIAHNAPHWPTFTNDTNAFTSRPEPTRGTSPV